MPTHLHSSTLLSSPASDIHSSIAAIESAIAATPSSATVASPRRARAHKLAALNWLRRYRPPAAATPRQGVQGYLEAFHHLCQLEQWELAYRLMTMPLETPTAETLHNELGTWGYQRDRLDLYQALLGKLPLSQEALLLDGLGHTYHSLGQYETALIYGQRYGEVVAALAEPVRQMRYEGLLGILHHALGHYATALDHHQQRLTLSQQLDHTPEKLDALGDLGIVYYSLGEYAAALSCHKQQLQLSRAVNDRIQVGQALGSLGHVYEALGQCLAIARETQNQAAKAQALHTLGLILPAAQATEGALEYLAAALAIFEEIGDVNGQGITLYNLGRVYTAIGDWEQVARCWLYSLAIFIEMDLSHRISPTLEALQWLQSLMQEHEFSPPEIAALFAEPLSEIDTIFSPEISQSITQKLLREA